MASIKFQDTATDVSERSRLDMYWKQRGFDEIFKRFRTGPEVKSKLQSADQLFGMVDTYKLKGLAFGNWVNMEDRFNYASAMWIALYDLNLVLKFNNNIGLGKNLTVAFGARGKGKAVAHYEPGTHIINLTRYKTAKMSAKATYFLYTGGVGSFAHEYGHALDYYFGGNVDRNPNSVSLSGGSVVAKVMRNTGGPFRKLMDKILTDIIFKDFEKGILSDYYIRMTKETGGKAYFKCRTELFARFFEKYVQYKLKAMGINNKFLTETKYNEALYLSDKEMAKLVPVMDEMLSLMRWNLPR